jgi:hypothetical protein
MDAFQDTGAPKHAVPSNINAATRRPVLLPAFEPVSSSPPAPSNKRKYQDDEVEQGRFYPTPVPTSSTGILPSSPGATRPGLKRTLSERAVLCDVPTVTIPANGQPLLLGRSSNSSNYQLPYNKNISRVHVSVLYEHPSETNASGQLKIECLGWNGCNVHCAGRVYNLKKDDIHVAEHPVAEIILDVQDTRVILSWPSFARGDSINSDSSWAEASPSRRLPHGVDVFASSPPALHPRSPVSPSPAHISRALFTTAAQDTPSWGAVKVYEDPASDSADAPDSPSKIPSHDNVAHVENAEPSGPSFISSANDPSDDENEENDPIIHSFGPFGQNILSRMNSFATTSPQTRRRNPLKEASPSPQRQPSASPHKNSSPRKHLRDSPIRNHVINQLAFSRVHAIPVSSIFGNLPADLKDLPAQDTSPSKDKIALTHDHLREILHSIPCVGEIAREGKDAAGKPLENEFYYLPDMDDNLMRREAVVGSRGGTGLRAVRKNHKVCLCLDRARKYLY